MRGNRGAIASLTESSLVHSRSELCACATCAVTITSTFECNLSTLLGNNWP
jgi:hypothetical protein